MEKFAEPQWFGTRHSTAPPQVNVSLVIQARIWVVSAISAVE